MLSFSRFKKEAAMIRRIFKGEPEAYRLIIEHYQPMAYAIALAQTGSVFLADKAVAAAFEGGYGRLVSLTDARKLGSMMCSLAQHESEVLMARRSPNWNVPRVRTGASPVDLQWVQTELIEPLVEELGSFTPQERKGILLHTFCGLNARQIANVLKIEHKEASEDLARTRENVEKALLGEVFKALYPEINNKERLVHIIATVGGKDAAEKAAGQTHIGRRPFKLVPILIAVVALLVVGILGYFGYQAVGNPASETPGNTAAAPVPPPPENSGSETSPPPDASGPPQPTPSNYSLVGRVVDERFLEDGVGGITVETIGMKAETDSYGAFEIRGVARGEHRVTVSHDGKILKQDVRMHTAEKNPSIPIPVDQSMTTRFQMRGRVTDRVTGQVITDFEETSSKEFAHMLQPYLLDMFRAQHHPEGLLQVPYVTLGEYTAWVRAKGYAPLAVHFSIDENWDNQRIFEFPLHRATALEGVVYNANELSINGASIVPRQGSAYGIIRSRVDYKRTNSMGRFEMYDLPVGVQSFIITHLEHGTARAIVDLEAGKTTQVRIRVPHHSALSGDITLNQNPVKFKEFRRRVSGSGVDLLKNIDYLSPGQYEIPLTPEPVSIWASVEPSSSDAWFDRRLEQDAVVSTSETTWLDFNFNGGEGVIQGAVTLQGAPPRAAFVEVVFVDEKSTTRERIFYDIGASGSFRCERLPMGAGEVTVYVSPRAVSVAEFGQARTGMDKRTEPFKLENTNKTAYVNLNL